MENGLPASVSVSAMPRVSRYRPSHGWYGSVFVPSAIVSPAHLGSASSARSRSTALILTTMRSSKSLPPSRPRYSWVGRAKQYVQAWLQPRYGLMVNLNGTRAPSGTRLMMR